MNDTKRHALPLNEATAKFVVLVIEPAACRVLWPLGQADDRILRCCVAEDPRTWEDMALAWPRYGYVMDGAEGAEQLPVGELPWDWNAATGRPDALFQAAVRQVCESADGWMVIDLVHQRIFCSGLWSTGHAESTPALAPWWEVHERHPLDELEAIWRSRATPVVQPNPHRRVLWGEALTRFAAQKLIELVLEAEIAGKEWQQKDRSGEATLHYDLVVAVHRAWLMTPRSDLERSCPRDCLHGGMDWISGLADWQFVHAPAATNEGDAVSYVPVSEAFSNYEVAPMGRHEVIMYFEACRELITMGGKWLMERGQRLHETDAATTLALWLDECLHKWWYEAEEMELPPYEVVQCCRQRIPLIENNDRHAVDCDCPVCAMFESGLFGPTVIGFDGHQLEMDDEFAFSLCATRNEWERQQSEWSFDDDEVGDGACDVEPMLEWQDDDEEEWGSVWQSSRIRDEEMFASHPQLASLGLAFQLAEIIMTIKMDGGDQQEVDGLNDAFRAYREAGDTDQFVTALERSARQHAVIESRSADLQSRVHALARAMPPDDLPY